MDKETKEYIDGMLEIAKEKGIKSSEWWKEEDNMNEQNEYHKQFFIYYMNGFIAGFITFLVVGCYIVGLISCLKD